MANETLLPGGFVNTLNLLFGTMKVLLGGVFGLAIVMGIFKFIELRTMKNIIKEIKQDTDVINEKILHLERKIDKWKKQKKK